MAKDKIESRIRRKKRIRGTVSGTTERPRLTVFRSARHIYAQVIDDVRGVTLASTSTMSKQLRDAVKGLKKREAAEKVGETLARECIGKNVAKVAFDRNGYHFHGRVLALAKGARKAGLQF